MKKTVFFTSLLLLASCGNNDSALKEKELELKEKELELKEKEMALNENESSNSSQAAVESTETNNQSDPKKVVQMVFDAAKSGEYESLMTICDPLGEGDGDTRRICGVANADAEFQKEFVEYFKHGQVIGEPTIDGDKAMVQIKFGPQGGKDETMNLINRNGNWYLYGL